jgi:gamma-glutamyl phosphate reductase
MRLLTAAVVAAGLTIAALPALAQQGQGGQQQMLQRFEQMEQMRGQMRQSESRERQRELQREHRRLMQQQAQDLDGLPRPDPNAPVEERLRVMEQRHEAMTRMMREMIEGEPDDD